jgi:eukaryotic-like serine/threonine-protein kinase
VDDRAANARISLAHIRTCLRYHREIVVSDPIGALAHLQLGRAFALSGDTTNAKTAYQDFLTLWKDADSDIPILKRAQAEYAKLQ